MRTSLGLVIFVTLASPTLASDDGLRTVRMPWLELPIAGISVEANSVGTLTMKPSDMHELILHIPTTRSRIPFGSIHTKVNLEAADMAMTTSVGEDGLHVDIDLDSKSGFPMCAGRNSVELIYKDAFGRERYFNYLLDLSDRTPNVEHDEDRNPDRRPIPRKGRLFVLAVGVSSFEDGNGSPTQLHFAHKDAEAVLQFFRSPEGGGARQEDTLLLTNENATSDKLRVKMRDFLARPMEQDTVVLYFAGHGAPDPQHPANVYLMAYNSKTYNLQDTALPMYEFENLFAHVLVAKHVVTLVDSCHAYGITGELSGHSSEVASINLINQYIEHFAGQGERAVITASDVGGNSYEDSKWGGGHGAFTYYLLEGLKGAADLNHDGTVTTGELFQYLKKNVPCATNGQQHPRAMAGFASNLILSKRTSQLLSSQRD